MDKIEIEIPDGKTAKVDKQDDGNILIIFKDEYWKRIKNVGDAVRYLLSHSMCPDLIMERERVPSGSYIEKIAAYRIVVAALTNNEVHHLTTGEKWIPVVQFCKPGKERNCYGSEIIGSIESDGQRFTVVSGCANYSTSAGLGSFDSQAGVSYSRTDIGFRVVFDCEIAKHISKYFGRLLFDIIYGGVNCDWEWVD